jgi:hypothetical protein
MTISYIKYQLSVLNVFRFEFHKDNYEPNFNSLSNDQCRLQLLSQSTQNKHNNIVFVLRSLR